LKIIAQKEKQKKNKLCKPASINLQSMRLFVPSRKRTEKIPTGILLSFDFIDDGQLSFSSHF